MYRLRHISPHDRDVQPRPARALRIERPSDSDPTRQAHPDFLYTDYITDGHDQVALLRFGTRTRINGRVLAGGHAADGREFYTGRCVCGRVARVDNEVPGAVALMVDVEGCV